MSEPGSASAAARQGSVSRKRQGFDGFLLAAVLPRLATAAALSAALWLAFWWAVA